MKGKCFYCSSPEHWANACPVKQAHKSEDKLLGQPAELEAPSVKGFQGRGRPKPGVKHGAKAKALGSADPSQMPTGPKVAAATGIDLEGMPQPTSSQVSTFGPSQAQLVQEATEVLRSLRLKALTDSESAVYRVRQLKVLD